MSIAQQNIERQVQELIDQAPADGQTPQLMRVLAPVFLQVAQQLRYGVYYILQSVEGEWLITTLSNRNQPELEKQVVYCYGSEIEAQVVQPGAIAVGLPIVQLLFQLAAIPELDALVCFEEASRVDSGIEIRRSDLQALMELQIRRVQEAHDSAQLGSDIA
jgi:hypothetical protein